MTPTNETPWTTKRDDGAWSKELATEKRLLIERMELPTHALAALKNYRPTGAIQAASTGCSLLVLTGSPGTGKTVAAVKWLADYVHDDGNWTSPGSILRLKQRAPVFVTAARLARWDRYEQEPMAKLLCSARLAIDDLGAEYLDKNGFYASLLDEVINERYAAERPTLLTTNLDPEAFKSRYGDRIADRIREVGEVHGCGRQSLRGAA